MEWEGFPYSFKWSASGRVESIRSYFGDIAFLKTHQVITKEFSIAFISDLSRATARCDETEHSLITFFGKDTKTRTHLQDKKGGGNTIELLHEAKKQKLVLDAEAARHRGKAGEQLLVTESTADRESKKRKAELARQAAVRAKAARVQTLDLSAMAPAA